MIDRFRSEQECVDIGGGVTISLSCEADNNKQGVTEKTETRLLLPSPCSIHTITSSVFFIII
jgi:hypothetical protein